jgi:hypothetical protein
MDAIWIGVAVFVGAAVGYRQGFRRVTRSMEFIDQLTEGEFSRVWNKGMKKFQELKQQE